MSEFCLELLNLLQGDNIRVEYAWLTHVAQRQFVASVVRDGENSGGAVVSVANVTCDFVGDDF